MVITVRVRNAFQDADEPELVSFHFILLSFQYYFLLAWSIKSLFVLLLAGGIGKTRKLRREVERHIEINTSPKDHPEQRP